MDTEQLEPEQEVPSDGGNSIPAIGWIIFWSVLSLLITLTLTITYTKAYGFGLYIGVPVTIGFTVGFIRKPNARHSFAKILLIAFIVTLAVCFLLMLMKMEGAICVIMILGPLYLLILLGYGVGLVTRANVPKNNMLLLPLLLVNPACIVADTHVGMTTHSVTSTMIVAAPEARVWNVITHYVRFDGQSNFFFKSGVNYPKDMQLMKRDDSLFLHCNLRNGTADLYVDLLKPEKKMQFLLLHEVTPMKELTIYDSLDAPHTHGNYFRLNYGSFELQAVDAQHTKVIARSDFSYKLAPAPYWNIWSNYLVDKMHMFVLGHVKEVSESAVQ